MAFIFGIVDLGKNSVNPDDVRTLCNAVKWDGFEDEIEIGESYALGFCWNTRRVPKAGIYKNENLIVVCDARIYNVEELKTEIDFESPAEAFAKAYQKWGEQCANKFNGDFSVVIIDSMRNKVVLFRDHIGVRPLCYTFRDNLLLFASHEFGIAKSHLIDNSISEETFIRGFFRHKKKKYSQTVFEQIQKVVPGYNMTISSNKKEVVKYWSPEKIRKNKDLSFQEAVLHLRQLLIESTIKRIEPGMLGVHVSGGIDSSGVAAIIADHIDDKKRCIGYSWSPEESMGEVEGVNEKELIEDFVRQKNLLIKYFKWDEENLIDDFIHPEFEQMSIEKQTMAQASNDNIETLFSGWGGDEFVSLSLRGSLNHIVFRFKFLAFIRWIRHFGIKGTIGRALGEVLPLLVPFGLLNSSGKFKRNFKFFKRSFIRKHWKLFFFNERRNIYGYGNRTGFMLNLLKNYHLPQRMDSWCLFGEKYGIEYKYPLLDKNLLEFWFSVPVKYTYQTMSHRYLYREAMKGILTENIRMRTDKDEAIFEKYNQNHNRKIKVLLAENQNKYFENIDLNIFRLEEFKKILTTQTDDLRRFLFQIMILKDFLRYKMLCEKYLDSNHDLTNTRKEVCESEIL